MNKNELALSVFLLFGCTYFINSSKEKLKGWPLVDTTNTTKEQKTIVDTSTPGYKFFKAALNYIGIPYSWGGRSKKKLDCMGLLF